ncbi:MAG TPA: hypothetical protein VMN99_01535 [Anaerolineales bacterium]|nr:hypothetical protein [Anaerolineales bacterium]
MDPVPSMIAIIASICIVVFGILALAGSLYGILVWYPRYRQKRVDTRKATGRQGYKVDKTFTFPTPTLGLLEVGKVVAVWVDPNEPRNLLRL